MVQNPKGGLSSSLGGSTQIGGVQNFRLLDKVLGHYQQY
jgi:hypothetical protein